MKNVLILKIWPVVAGLVTAFIVMMIFEYANSFFYPLPPGLDMTDTKALQAFTASLPWTAYILVFVGWVLASFKAGCVTTYLAKEQTYKLSFLVGIILALFGLINNFIIGHDMLFTIIVLPVFIVFTYLGHRYLLYIHRARKTQDPRTP